MLAKRVVQASKVWLGVVPRTRNGWVYVLGMIAWCSARVCVAGFNR